MINVTGGKDTRLELTNGSVVTGKQIIIAGKDATVVVGEDSSIWSSGQSISTKGTLNLGLGALYIGQSGYCGDQDTSSMKSMARQIGIAKRFLISFEFVRAQARHPYFLGF